MRIKAKAVWWVFLGILLIIAAVRVFMPAKSPVEFQDTSNNQGIVVYITGAVAKPGMLQLPLDARLDDALKAAEVSAEADLNTINPAQKLKDGQKIIVPVKSLMEENDAVQGKPPVSADSQSKASSSSIGKININTAGLAELDNIPGIGPALAQRIIDYRSNNGFFGSPEDLKNVPGIGDKTYEKMSGYLTVGQ